MVNYSFKKLVFSLCNGVAYNVVKKLILSDIRFCLEKVDY